MCSSGLRPRKPRDSAGVPRALRRSRALPSLRTLPLHQRLATADEQAIAFPLALAAYSPVVTAHAMALLRATAPRFVITYRSALASIARRLT